MEIWKDIEGYEGYYQVSNIGRIKSVDRHVIKSDGIPNFIKGRLKSPSAHSNGYLRIFLYRDAKIKSFYAHRLVAQAFIPNPDNKPVVNHKDGDKLNNHWTNLEWNTSLENSHHALRIGLITPQKGKDVVLGLPEGWELEINEAYTHFPDFNKVIPQPDNIFNGDLGRKEEEMCKREGRPTWLNWNRENWETKWNSYSIEKEDDNIFIFETAWSPVLKIVRAMSIKFPEIEFRYEFADEDTGSNTGSFIFINGGAEGDFFENQSTEAYEMAFKLRPEYKQDYQLVDGEYLYIEDNE